MGRTVFIETALSMIYDNGTTWTCWQTHPWWRHQMGTFSALLALCVGISPVTSEFPSQRPVTRGFDVFFDLCLNKRLSKQSWGWWLQTPSCSLWRHCNAHKYHDAFDKYLKIYHFVTEMFTHVHISVTKSLISTLNKRLSKQSWGWWFETPSRPLCRHRNVSISLSISIFITVFEPTRNCVYVIWQFLMITVKSLI